MGVAELNGHLGGQRKRAMIDRATAGLERNNTQPFLGFIGAMRYVLCYILLLLWHFTELSAVRY